MIFTILLPRYIRFNTSTRSSLSVSYTASAERREAGWKCNVWRRNDPLIQYLVQINQHAKPAHCGERKGFPQPACIVAPSHLSQWDDRSSPPPAMLSPIQPSFHPQHHFASAVQVQIFRKLNFRAIQVMTFTIHICMNWEN